MALFVIPIAAALFPWEDTIAFTYEVISPKLTVDRFGKIVVELFLILPALFLLEGLAVGWQRSSVRRLLFRKTASNRFDLLVYAAGELRLPGILATLIVGGSTGGLALLGNGVLAGHLGIGHLTRVENPLLGLVLFLLVRDFGYYWYHRLQHTRIFWPLHRLHHSAREFSILTSYRTNVLGEVLIGWMLAIPLALLTLPAESLLIGQLIVVTHGHLIHSEIRGNWGWIGRWIMVSPLHHRMHHGMRRSEYGSNFATLPIWDRLFGTYREPWTRDIRIGLNHPGYESVRGCIAMMFFELSETARLVIGLPVDDPTVASTNVSLQGDGGVRTGGAARRGEQNVAVPP